MDFEEAIKEYERTTATPTPTHMSDSSSCCGQEYVVVDGFATCTICGIAGVVSQYIVQHKGFSVRRYASYKRISYFRHVLALVSCRKRRASSRYSKAVARLKTQQFDTLPELRRLMKKKKMSKLYPDIFLLYRDIKGVEVVSLTTSDMDQLVSLFRQFETTLRRAGKAKHFYSYFLLLNIFLKKLHHPSWDRVSIPISNKGKVQEVDDILSSLVIHHDNEKYSYQIKGSQGGVEQ